jgi:hypothetical protein
MDLKKATEKLWPDAKAYISFKSERVYSEKVNHIFDSRYE